MNLEYVKELNCGGFGRISLYREIRKGKLFVMKTLLDPTFDNCQRLIREGQIYLALANNPHIVDLVAYSFEQQNPYLILPYYEHGTLESWVGNTNWRDALMVIQHISLALRGIHKLGGFQRDIKPPNIYDTRSGNTRMFKLGDFGVSRILHPFTNSEITKSVLGTNGYIAPELYSRNAEYGSACDIYSLGVTAIELITGSRRPDSIKHIWINDDAKKLLMDMTSLNLNIRPNVEQILYRTKEIIKNCDKSFNNSINLGLFALGGIFLHK